MNRSELVEKLADKAEVSLALAKQATDTIVEAISKSLVSGQRTEIRGFGSFGTNITKPRTARNPKTGATVEVPKKKRVFFKAGRELRHRAGS